MGPILNKKGKFPSICDPSEEGLKRAISEATRKVRVQQKKTSQLSYKIGLTSFSFLQIVINHL